MDRKDIRDRMQNVFGTYNDFCHTLSNTSNNNLTRHGVLQTPTTPVTARAPVFPPRPQSPAVAPPSVRECVQVMSDLVSSPPLQPPQLSIPLSFHRGSPYLNHASSTRSSPDDSEARKKKRKHKNHESDSEVEKRKRPKEVPSELAKPSTSQDKPQEDDAMKALFGDDNSKPGGSEKGVSPDSGVHSTENDGNEEFDINTIVNTMSNILPMLSPPTDRPLVKQKIREKEERRKREHEEQKAREREEKAREREEKAREREEKAREREEKAKEREEKAREEARKKMEEERRVAEEKERERKAAEEREKKQAEERKEREKKAAAEKRMAEEREKKLAEEREKEERRERKAAEEKEKKQAEEREKKQAEERERERTAAEEREKKQVAEDKERRKADERRKAEEEKKKVEEKASSSPANQPLTEASNRISGVLPLHLLSSDKMSKLLDLGRKSGKMEIKSEKRPKSPLVTAESTKKRKEREEPPANEGERGESSKKSVKNDIKNEPESISSPRPGSSLSGKEFRCACNEVLPSKPVRAQIPAEKKDENLQNHAKSLKRKADATPDHVRKILLYLDSIVYFALGARFLNYQEKVSSRKASIYRETADLAKQTTSRFTHSDSLTPLQQHFVSRVRSLSVRVQSVLLYNLYNAKSSNTLRTFQMIEQGEDQISIHKGDEAGGSDGKTSSPGGSSVHSSSNQAPSGGGTVTMPLDQYQLHRSQMKMLHNLMWAHKMWQDADHMAHNNPTDTQFINSLESLCGSLCMTTPMEKISTFFLTGINWLRDEYETEMRRPPPPKPKSS